MVNSLNYGKRDIWVNYKCLGMEEIHTQAEWRKHDQHAERSSLSQPGTGKRAKVFQGIQGILLAMLLIVLLFLKKIVTI